MSKLKIGWGRRDCSTNEPVNMPGQMYMRISEGVMDPLYATALCLDGGEGEDAVIFCSCDLGNFNNGLMQTVLDQVSMRRPEIPQGAVILNCTHNHSCSDTRPTPEHSPDGKLIYPSWKYGEFLIEQIVQAICEAWDTRAEGGVAYGYGYAVVAHSRRSIYFEDMSVAKDVPVSPNGHGIMYGNTRDPLFSHYEAGADHFLNVMFTVDPAGQLTGIVVNVPCPSQLSEHFTMLSADFWGDVRQMVAQEYGENIYVLPQCAAAGDLSPRILHYKEAQCRRMKLKYGLEYPPTAGAANHDRVMGERWDIAERICSGIREVYGWAMKDICYALPVRHKRIEVMLPARLITRRERDWCAENIEMMRTKIPDEGCSTPEQRRKAITEYESIKNRNQWVLEDFETQKPDDTYPVVINTVRVGEIAFATNQFELYMDYMHRIQARSPFIQTFIIQLAGAEYGGYLATERGTVNKGYSASLFDNRVPPQSGQQLVELTLKALEEISKL